MNTIRWSTFLPLLTALALLAGGCEHVAVAPTTTATVVSADGVKIRYDVAGTGETALVFVHCWTCNRHFWDESFSYFGKRYQVVRLDLAGHGESGNGRRDYTMAAFGSDVATVADALGLKRIVLIGHSMGGPVSVEAEQRLGARVIGVVGVDTFHTGFPLPKDDAEAAAFVKPFEDDFKSHVEKFMRSMFTPQSDPALIDRIGETVSRADPTMAISRRPKERCLQSEGKVIYTWLRCRMSLGLLRNFIGLAAKRSKVVYAVGVHAQ